jgi:hypothetical protein
VKAACFQHTIRVLSHQIKNLITTITDTGQSKETLMIANKTTLGASVVALLFTILLAGCGGGGSGGETATTSYTLPSVINAVPAQQ